MYSPAAATMMALRPAAAATTVAGRRALTSSAMSRQASSLNSLKNSFWDALSAKSPKANNSNNNNNNNNKAQTPKDGSSSSSGASEPRSDQAVRGRGFARRRPSLFSSPSASSPSSPRSSTAKSGEGAAPTGSGSNGSAIGKHRSGAARRSAPVAHSSAAQSRYPERFIFETYQPPALAEINFVSGNPWARNLASLSSAPAGQLLTEEKAQIIREYIGGDYSGHVATLPKEVDAKLDVKQKKVVQGAMRVLNANASYKIQDKMTVVATVVEGVTAGKVKRSEVLKN